ncbi:MAG TPA: AMP nucleosidase, partial [Reyranella sp.]|nr:AMP nucleosidase [Reyranella sp.]
MTPEQAVDRLEHLHSAASNALREALARYTGSGIVPTVQERSLFRYPELCVDWQPSGAVHFTRRAWAKFQSPGLYVTTVTQPTFFRQYLLEQLRPLASEFGARIEVRTSAQEIPYPFVTEEGDEFVHGDLSVADLARHFPTPMLANVGDEVVDGT